jgi:hypothetical protein
MEVYEGEIIVDPQSWMENRLKKREIETRRYVNSSSGSESDRSGDEIHSSSGTGTDSAGNDESNNPRRNPVNEWRRLRKAKHNDHLSVELTAHQRTLLPTCLKGYALKHKLWSKYIPLGGCATIQCY